MPELPEVETVMKGMEKQMLGHTLHYVDVHVPKLRWALPPTLKGLKNKKITSFSRRSKYVLMTLEDQVVLIHLGMSGKIVFSDEKSYVKQKHDHVVFNFGDQQLAIYNDARRFGMVDVFDISELSGIVYLNGLGPEPLLEDFTSDYFQGALAQSRLPIKTALMQPKIVVGVGNIYASESLYRAKISPLKRSLDLKPAEIKRLHTVVQAVLREAIVAGGSTLKDYVQADGSLGYFQHSFKVYGKQGEPCPACKAPILKITQNQRSTFYCEKCQS